MRRKFVSLVKAFFSGEEEEKEEKEGFIDVVTPELKTKVKFDVKEGVYCTVSRINGQIEVKLEKVDEVK